MISIYSAIALFDAPLPAIRDNSFLGHFGIPYRDSVFRLCDLPPITTMLRGEHEQRKGWRLIWSRIERAILV
jgi:hypothetical protein